MKVHDEIKPYSCNICNKSYHYKAGLKVHMDTHSGVLPFVCHFCDKRFSQKGAFNVINNNQNYDSSTNNDYLFFFSQF